MIFGRACRVSGAKSAAALAALAGACRQAVASRCFTRVPCVHAIGLAALIAAGGCDSSSSTTTDPSPVKCQVALSTSSTALAAGGGTGAVSVSTQPECAWSATAEASWISELSPASGQGNGQVAFRVSANPLPSVRQGDDCGERQSPLDPSRRRNVYVSDCASHPVGFGERRHWQRHRHDDRWLRVDRRQQRHVVDDHVRRERQRRRDGRRSRSPHTRASSSGPAR